MHRKIYYREFYYNMNIIKMFMNNVIILLLAIRICEDSDNRGSDKRGCTVNGFSVIIIIIIIFINFFGRVFSVCTEAITISLIH